MGERRAWEKSYPAGVRWDAPIETATLPALFDAFTEKWAAKPALEYRDRWTTYAELRATVDAVASGLTELGVKPGRPSASTCRTRPTTRSYSLPCSSAAGASCTSPRSTRSASSPSSSRTRARASLSRRISAPWPRWRGSSKPTASSIT